MKRLKKLLALTLASACLLSFLSLPALAADGAAATARVTVGGTVTTTADKETDDKGANDLDPSASASRAETAVVQIALDKWQCVPYNYY